MEIFYDAGSQSLVIWTGGTPVLEAEFPLDKMKELVERAEKEKASRIVWAIGSGSPIEVIPPEEEEGVELPILIPFLSPFKPESPVLNFDGKIPVLLCYPAVIDEKLLKRPQDLSELKEKLAKYESLFEKTKSLPELLRRLADLIEKGEIREEELDLLILLGEMIETHELIESAEKFLEYVEEAKKKGVEEIDADQVEKMKLYDLLKKKLRGE